MPLLSQGKLFVHSRMECIEFWQGCERGQVQRAKGVGSDALLLVLKGAHLAVLESKAMFRATPYLQSARPKYLPEEWPGLE